MNRQKGGGSRSFYWDELHGPCKELNGIVMRLSKRKTAKITSIFVFCSSNEFLNTSHKNWKNVCYSPQNTNIFTLLYKQLKMDGKSVIFAICKIREDVSKYVQSSRILSLRIYVEKGWFPFGYQFQEKVKRNLRNLQITDAFESDRDVIIYFAILILDRINIKRKRLGDDTGIIN